MLPITEKIVGHYIPDPKKTFTLTMGGKPVSFKPKSQLPKNLEVVSVAQIRESSGFKIKRFRHLVRCIAELAYYNPQYSLLYRGQDDDYRDKMDRSKVYPTIYRPEVGGTLVRSIRIEDRYDRLKLFFHQLRRSQKKISSHRRLISYPEYYYSLIQHYNLAPTPLIDLTQSLRVAASFALRGRNTGFVFVFGMPYPQGSISHFVDAEMVLVKLLSVCPPIALRPHYQEGFLVGKLPFNSKKEVGDNLAKRLVGKYRLDNSDGKFWDRGFSILPDETLMPERDPFHKQLLKITSSSLNGIKDGRKLKPNPPA